MRGNRISEQQIIEVLQEALRCAGYRAGFALDNGTALLAFSAMAIPRLGIREGIVQSEAHFQSKISGWN